MLLLIRHSVLFCLIASLVTVARSQTPSTEAIATDDDWAQVQKSATESIVTVRSGSRERVSSVDPTRGTPGVETSPIAAEFVNRADELRDFRLAHPGAPQTSEAQRLEALMLIKAQSFSATVDTDRCDQLVARARKDQLLSEDDRFSLVFLADLQKLILQQFDSEQKRLEQFETTARDQIAEFPTVPQAYEGFLNLAKCCPDDQAARIATDLAKMDAPATVKEGAQTLADRCALVGRSLQIVLSAGLSTKELPTLAKNRITVLYSWEISNEGGFRIAQEIVAKAPVGATIIGLNLDTDISAAKRIAAAQALPGLQLYDSAGPDSKVARALKLTRDMVVIIANRNGEISTVSGQLHLADKIAAVNQ